ncbi:MAG TPA: glycosyltransferase family 9 protein [Chloroflexia bacterium]|nr:glycosyltransferase family 9 protein [Chloroflexia bacterium]
MPEQAPSTHPQLKRILAVKLADLGDVLMLTPALQALHSAQPLATLDLLVPPSSDKLLRGVSFIDRVITFDKFAFDSPKSMLNLGSLLRTLAFLLKLRRSKYDAIIIFHHLTLGFGAIKFRMLALTSGARWRVGLDNGRGGFLNIRAVDEGFGAMHEADYWLGVASLLGADPSVGWRPVLPISDADREVAARLLAPLEGNEPGPLVAVHPGAGAYSKARIWPAEGFAQVARELGCVYNARVVLVGGPDEAGAAKNLEASLEGEVHILNLTGQTTIHETAAVLQRCDLFVGNDSGPMHIASTVGTPVVSIFGPSNWRAWGPYTPPGEENPHKIVARDLPCMPCLYRGHSLGLREGCGPRPCLTGLHPDSVIAACAEILARAGMDVPSTEPEG